MEDHMASREKTTADAATPEEALPLGWQPIKTAPLDGTWLLLFCPGGVDERDYDARTAPNVTIGNWDANTYQSACWLSVESYTEFWDYGGMTGAGTSTYRTAVAPTHWMPLPAPPQ